MAKTTKGDVREIGYAIAGLLKEKLTVGFKYGLAKNKNLIRDEFDALVELDKRFGEIDKERVDLCKKYCDKDENENPIIKDNNYVGCQKHPEFNKELDKNKDELDEHKKQTDEYYKEEIEIDFYKVKRDKKLDDIETEVDISPLVDVILED